MKLDCSDQFNDGVCFKNVSNKYRPIPFWSWNEKLDTNETREQVRIMHQVGIGGFFMHARGGLQTEYMGTEWFENVDAAVDEASKWEMDAWVYDENGWPSGFGDGQVNGLGVRYQQKYLRMEDVPEHSETAICKSGEHWFYYDVNPFYVDTLDKDVIKVFIEKIYQPYYDRYQGKIKGFFTDEPQISRNGIPWSFVYEHEYQERYADVLNDHLEELFLDQGNYVTTRFRFWKMVTDLFSSAYMKQIYNWCNAHDLKLTGHLASEGSLLEQVTCNGACMPLYEYFHIPGMDWLGRNIFACLIAKQVSSVAEQMGKELVLAENFALCGHNVSFDELKGIYEWQMVRGINLLCQHLEGYSIRGMRKRDYPPAMYCQQPWWEFYRIFVDSMSRVGMILSSGKKECSVLLLHPQTKAWTLYNGRDMEPLNELNKHFLDTISVLEKKHIEYHFGDETIMERHAYVEDGCIVIGKQRYTDVIMIQDEVLFDSTRKLLADFEKRGGRIVAAQELEAVPVINSDLITYTVRAFDNYKVHYFVNSFNEKVCAQVFVKGKKLDIATGKLIEFDGVHCFEPYGSLMIVEEHGACTRSKEEKSGACTESKEEKRFYVNLENEMEVVNCTPNSLTLDTCDYYFDGVLQEKNGYVLNITERANALGRPVEIHQDYFFTVKQIPDTLSLVCETPEIFKIKVNGCDVTAAPYGYFRDKSFRCIDIRDYLQTGQNTISFDCHFAQSEKVYENLKNAFIFESEKNKLSYDAEIEAIYLIGNFCVNTPGEWSELPNNADRYHGVFEIDQPKKKVVPADLQRNGFPFFSGSITLKGKILVHSEQTVLKLNRKGVNALKVQIAGKEKTFLWGCDEIELSGWATLGENDIVITLTNNLRNLLGPHHLDEGESYKVGPGSFFKEKCIWLENGNCVWDEGYCLVKFGV